MNSVLFFSVDTGSANDCLWGFHKTRGKSNFSAPLLRIFCRGNKISSHQAFHIYNKKNEVISDSFVPNHLEGGFHVVNIRTDDPPISKVKTVRTLLIDNYDSYTYNIYQELSVVNGVSPVVIRNDEWKWEDAWWYLYQEKAFDNIVISPGPGSPRCSTDIGICLRLLLECADIPILGVCLGHQALGYTHGARVIPACEPVHGRLSEIEHNGCRLFHNIPSCQESGFKVVRYHSLIIDSKSLPKELIPIAWTASDTLSFGQMHDIFQNQSKGAIFSHNDLKMPQLGSYRPSRITEKMQSRVLMGIRHSTRPHYGLQFHPESIATCYRRQMFHNFRAITDEYWQELRSRYTNHENSQHAALQVPSFAHSIRVAKCQSSTCSKKVQSTRGSGICVKHLRLNWRRLDRFAAQIGGGRNIFCKMFGLQKAENTFWLDSSSTEKGRARFSFMGGRGGPLWKKMTYRLSRQSDQPCKGGQLWIEDAYGTTKCIFLNKGFLAFLNQELALFHHEEMDFQGLPFEFFGGYVGYLGYDLKAECGMAANHHKSKTPDACFFFADEFLVIDHLLDDVYIISLHEEGTPTSPWLNDAEKKLRRMETCSIQKHEVQDSQPPPFISLSLAGFSPDKSRQSYMKDIQQCLEYIKDGESYELCLTTQLRKEVGGVDSLGLYLALRERNPAPYAAWLNFSSDNLCICCSSPERFLRLDRKDELEAKPIKGTVARGRSRVEDECLKLQLQHSEKDQAENLMIVDLLRNDLGRVSETGSVCVPNLMDVESYATVHTMVSTIRGRKRPDVSAIDCVIAAFPGGSMIGAPKLRSAQLLDSLESHSRGIYSGSIGFFSYNNTFDLNIVIRTIVIHEGEASIGAGGAIVSLSNPEDEFDEMMLKAWAPALAVAQFQHDQNPSL